MNKEITLLRQEALSHPSPSAPDIREFSLHPNSAWWKQFLDRDRWFRGFLKESEKFSGGCSPAVEAITTIGSMHFTEND